MPALSINACLPYLRGRRRVFFAFGQKKSLGTRLPLPLQEKLYTESNSETSIDECREPTSTVTVAVIGVGYVGLHLVQAFGRLFNVIAFDKSEQRIAELQTTLADFPSITLSSHEKDLSKADYFLIAVPTLIKNNSPDFSPLKNALEMIAKYARPGASVVIESSVGVGTTRRLLGPILRQYKLKGGMSPERVDPGRVAPLFEDIPKIISGLDDIAPGSLASINELYSQVFRDVQCVSKPEVAEMTKLYENCQRMVCIAYANEVADACSPHGIDPFEVFSAAATKPFGYLPVKSGIGVGGHCIPVNPHYLFETCNLPLLKEATQTVAQRPRHIAKRLLTKMQQEHFWASEARMRVLVVGVAFKRGQSSLSYSPALELLRSFTEDWNTNAYFADPFVPAEAVTAGLKLEDEKWTRDQLEAFDLIVVAVRQPGLDYEILEDLVHPVIERLD